MRDGQLEIAVIGGGIAGLGAAWLLSQRHRVRLFEAAPRLGGHSNTVTVEGRRGPIGVDTGFIVYNEPCYPNLTALFRHLGVATQPSDMSFAVSLDGGALEYAGSDLRGLLAQKRNLLRPRFYAMLFDLLRFYRAASAELPSLSDGLDCLGAFLDAHRFGRALREDHLLPMAAAIWSATPSDMSAYPAAAFIRFCDNHGLLRLTGRPVWRTVCGGSRHYVERLAADARFTVHPDTPVTRIVRSPAHVDLHGPTGPLGRFDHVVVAAQAHQALRMLDAPDPAEAALLGAFGHSRNIAVLHGDATLMPRRRAAWASWNYLGQRGAAPEAPCVSYWMNRLQALQGECDLFVTLNPSPEPTPGSVLYRTEYTHPLFDVGAMQAQRDLWSLQGRRRTWFCGAYFGAGFHEDGLQAGLAVAEQLGGLTRPWRLEAPSGRIHVHPVEVPHLEAA